MNDLKSLITTSLAGKLEELRGSLNSKLLAQEEIFNQKLKKLELEEEKKRAELKKASAAAVKK